MNIKNIRKFLLSKIGLPHGRAMRYGLLSALFTVIVTVVLVIINVAGTKIPGKLDLTDNRLYRLDPKSISLVKGLKSDINIYFLTTPNDMGDEDANEVRETLNLYAAQSPRILYKDVDPDRNPALVAKYREDDRQLERGTVVVANDTYHRVIAPYELITYDYQSAEKRIKSSNNVENRVTAAINYVATGSMPKIYTLVGHGELSPHQLGAGSNSLELRLKSENYMVDTVSLANQAVPADASLLMILSPQSDLSPYEADAIRDYLAKGGRVLLNVVYTPAPLVALTELVKSVGIDVGRGIIYTQDSSRLLPMLQNNPLYYMADALDGPIGDPLRKKSALPIVGQTVALSRTADVLRDLTVKEVLKSPANANLLSVSATGQAAPDASAGNGPFVVAYSVENTRTGGRMVINTGDLSLMGSLPVSQDYFMHASSWLNERADSITVPTKGFYAVPLRASLLNVLLLGGLFTIIFPAVSIILGAAMAAKRRNL